MGVLRPIVVLTVLGFASATHVTPLQQVITLLTDLKLQVKTEGETEAGNYDKFSCFCKDTTKTKSESIKNGQNDIDVFSATIEEKTAQKIKKQSELDERNANHEKLALDLKKNEVLCAKERSVFEATEADFKKAISGLEGAITALSTAKPATDFIALRKSVDKSLAIADVLNLIDSSKQRAISAFLQQKARVDPDDPEYKFHSQGILDTINKLKADFGGQLSELLSEWTKTREVCGDTERDLTQQIGTNGQGITEDKAKIGELKEQTATAREDLVNAESLLKEDQLYLKDLTSLCESRAVTWDQRSQMRADELKALSAALKILQEDVTATDTVNRRALLVQRKHSAVVHSKTGGGGGSLSFLQGVAMKGGRHSLVDRVRGGVSSQARRDQVVTMMREEGRRLGSSALSSLVVRLAEDPFEKVKILIQKLIERLLAESTSEATKKSFCDEALGKAKKDRTYRYAEVKKLNLEIASLEVQEQEFAEEIEELTSSLSTLRDDLGKTTVIRTAERTTNLESIKTAKEGLEAVTQAITILKEFYSQAAKSAALLQMSPVDADTTGAGFSSGYKGQQEPSKGIIGLLEVIKSDFERTARKTEQMEKTAATDYVEFDRSSRADIKGKETKKTLDEEDLESTRLTIEQKMSNLQEQMSLVDDAVNVIEDLKPTCIDSGMSFDERTQKRNDEIKALKNAVCLLDPEGVEEDCAATD